MTQNDKTKTNQNPMGSHFESSRSESGDSCPGQLVKSPTTLPEATTTSGEERSVSLGVIRLVPSCHSVTASYPGKEVVVDRSYCLWGLCPGGKGKSGVGWTCSLVMEGLGAQHSKHTPLSSPSYYYCVHLFTTLYLSPGSSFLPPTF